MLVKSGVNNSILSNSMSNTNMEVNLLVDLDGDSIDDDGGPTSNDGNGPDSGPNNLQNFPVLDAALIDADDDLVIEYRVDSASGNSTYPLIVEFFKVAENVITFLGSDVYEESDFDTGVLNFSTVVLAHTEGSPVLESDDLIVAMATDADGNTS